MTNQLVCSGAIQTLPKVRQDAARVPHYNLFVYLFYFSIFECLCMGIYT